MTQKTLNNILSWANLRRSWERVADNKGAPGPDQVSVKRFARNWEANLRRIQQLVRAGCYRTGRLHRIAIPKREQGRIVGQRLISIANVGDRRLQIGV